MKTVILMFALFFSSQAFSKQMEIVLEHSKVKFDVDYMMMTKVDGQFRNFFGFYQMNEEESEITNIKVDLESKSIDTNDGKRDFHLRGHEFFLTESYPYITFRSNAKVKIAVGEKFTLPGIINIRGIEKPLTLEGVYKGKLKDAWNKDNYFFTLNGSINRKDFKMTWNKTMDSGGLLLGDIVSINIALQTQLTSEKTPFSTHMVPSTKGIIERDLLKKGKIKKLTTSTAPDEPLDNNQETKLNKK